MLIEELFNEDWSDFDWNVIENIDCFKRLKTTPQHSVWHKEGNAWEHTKLVVSAMKDILPCIYEIHTGTYEWKLLMAAALCHDLGKGVTTTYDTKKEEYVTKNHGEAGEKIVRELFDEDTHMFDELCTLVRWHMTLHYVLDYEKNIDDKLIKLSEKKIPVRYFVILWHADSLGSINHETHSEILEKREKIINRCIDLDCYLTPYVNLEEETALNELKESLQRMTPYEVLKKQVELVERLKTVINGLIDNGYDKDEICVKCLEELIKEYENL